MTKNKKQSLAGQVKAERFKHNLRSLLARRGLTQREAAREIGVPYKWFRHLCHDGLARVHTNNRERLGLIRKFFGVRRLEWLWLQDLKTERLPGPAPLSQLDAYLEKLTFVVEAVGCNKYVRKAYKAIDLALEHAIGRGEMKLNEPDATASDVLMHRVMDD